MSRAEFKFYGLKLNVESDKDIIDFLDGIHNKQGCIKSIIRFYMKQLTHLVVKDEDKID